MMLLRKIIFTLSALTVINAHADKIHVSAIGADIDSCKMDHRCDLKGKHDIEIVNDSNLEHRYEYFYVICSIKENRRCDCNKVGNHVYVKAHSKWNNHYDSFISPIYSTMSGHADYVISTNLSGYQTEISENVYNVVVKH